MTKKYKAINIKVLVTLMIMLVFSTISLKATTNNDAATAEKVGFSLKANLPGNQINKSVTYFHLKTSPKAKQTISVDVKSVSGNTMNVETKLNVATTNRNGVVVYDGSTTELDSSLKIPITEVAKVRNSVITLNKGETKKVDIDITMPNKNYSGIILGGLNFKEVTAKQTEKKSVISSKYQYNIGLMLSESSKAAPGNSGNLNFKGIETKLDNGSKVTVVSLQNDQPLMMGKLNVDVKFRKKGESNVVLSKKTTEMSMAPNSVLPYYLDWGVPEVQNGKYTATIVAKSYKHVWTWTEDFEITNADQLNKDALKKLRLPFWLKITFVILAILTLGLVIYLYRRRRKESQ